MMRDQRRLMPKASGPMRQALHAMREALVSMRKARRRRFRIA